jgi:DNA polymerase III alpha subunit
MMNAKVEDLSGTAEIMIFPKSFEKTEAVWVVGTVAAIIGRRSSEQGDNKIFVEHAEILTPENVSEMKTKIIEMFGLAKNKKRFVKRDPNNPGGGYSAPAEQSSNASSSPEPMTIIRSTTIEIEPSMTTENKEKLRNLLASSRGDMKIFLSIATTDGQKRMIETDFAVDWNADFEQRIIALVGQQAILKE